ncbi:MAG: Ldh family oxidoreductase [Rhodospirillales bacterium]|nr:Ldh family oxidoreductase [Rhodospirillales bacterium]
MPVRSTHPVDIAALRRLMEDMLAAAGVAPARVAVVADVFVAAELQGNWIQGLQYLNTFIKNICLGRIDPVGEPAIVREGPAYALIEGNRGPGHPAGILAADTAVRIAKAAGSAIVGVANSSDIFMLSYYSERIAREGCVGLVFMNSPPTVHAHGGMEKALGTNPISIAVPTEDAHPFVIDIAATSADLSARIRLAQHYGEQLPQVTGLGPDGRPTTDPASVLAGAISPFAGHKSSGFGFCVALISGVLTGCAVGKGQRKWHGDEPGPAGKKGHVYMAIDPGAFGDAETFRKAASAYLAQVRASRAAPGSPGVRVPGDRAAAARATNARRGLVDIDGHVWDTTAKLAAELNVAMPF